MSKRALLITIIVLAAAATITARSRALSKNQQKVETATELPAASLKSVLNQLSPKPVTALAATPQSKSEDTLSGSTHALGSNSSLKLTAAPVSIARPTEMQQEHQAIETLTSILSNVVSTDSSPARLVTDLLRAGYEPLASRDGDPETGSMIVIQTKNTLPGSRYFRAQYFSDEDGNYQPQHISFELRPGTSQAVITEALTKAFGGALPAPSYQDAEWTSYKLADGYTLWKKVLNANDIQENAIFAHSAEDIGTIQVAIEKDIAGHEDEP